MKLTSNQIKELQILLDNGWVTRQNHPTEDLYIYKYTPSAQYDNIWASRPFAKMFRGLILNKDFEIISRPFEKFFNFEEVSNSLDFLTALKYPFEVYDKLDGSLGISYFVDGVPFIATQGSFTSEQALKATEILHTKYKESMKYMISKETYLFEIIYPENRIVVNYEGLEDIILLRVIDRYGKENPAKYYTCFGFNVLNPVAKFKGFEEIEKLKKQDTFNKEGYVLFFENGFRCKLKFETYIKLHKTLTRTSTFDIWECLKNNIPIEKYIQDVPDEFYNFIKDTVKVLKDNFKDVEEGYKDLYKTVEHLEDRKTFAMAVKDLEKYEGFSSSILFSMKDNKDYSKYIWDLVKPKFERWMF